MTATYQCPHESAQTELEEAHSKYLPQLVKLEEQRKSQEIENRLLQQDLHRMSQRVDRLAEENGLLVSLVIARCTVCTDGFHVHQQDTNSHMATKLNSAETVNRLFKSKSKLNLILTLCIRGRVNVAQ